MQLPLQTPCLISQTSHLQMPCAIKCIVNTHASVSLWLQTMLDLYSF